MNNRLDEGTTMKTNQQHDDFIMLPKNDFAFKLLFGDERSKDLRIDLLATILHKDSKSLTDLEYINTDWHSESPNDKRGILDVRTKQADNTNLSHRNYGASLLIVLEQDVCHPTKQRRALRPAQALHRHQHR